MKKKRSSTFETGLVYQIIDLLRDIAKDDSQPKNQEAAVRIMQDLRAKGWLICDPPKSLN